MPSSPPTYADGSMWFSKRSRRIHTDPARDVISVSSRVTPTSGRSASGSIERSTRSWGPRSGSRSSDTGARCTLHRQIGTSAGSLNSAVWYETRSRPRATGRRANPLREPDQARPFRSTIEFTSRCKIRRPSTTTFLRIREESAAIHSGRTMATKGRIGFDTIK